ncbi:MAG: hypothetical protein FJY91_01300 [Candidatus Harrisonbacteria bacterium]|nr:hypothetical protein [Candidatus Harrisonbacteria bacterium]
MARIDMKFFANPSINFFSIANSKKNSSVDYRPVIPDPPAPPVFEPAAPEFGLVTFLNPEVPPLVVPPPPVLIPVDPPVVPPVVPLEPVPPLVVPPPPVLIPVDPPVVPAVSSFLSLSSSAKSIQEGAFFLSLIRARYKAKLLLIFASSSRR